MKKFIIGFLSGAMIFGGASAFAASTLVGQKVQGTYTIVQNGSTIAEAAIINGSAYVPVRKMAEATGTTLEVEGKKIILQTDSGSTAVISTNVEYLQQELSKYQDKLAQLNEKLRETEENRDKQTEASSVASEQTFIDTVLKPRIAETEAQIKDLEAQITALQNQ